MPAKRFTKEEEQLLQNFSKHTTTKSAAVFYVYAFLVTVAPLCEFLLSTGFAILLNDS